jgi:hypothetical protein
MQVTGKKEGQRVPKPRPEECQKMQLLGRHLGWRGFPAWAMSEAFLIGTMGAVKILAVPRVEPGEALGALRMKSLRVGGPKSRGMTLLNCDQDTERCWKASMLRLLSLKIFCARKRKCSGSSPRLVPTSAMNLRFRVSHIFSQGTRSATTKGIRSWGGRGGTECLRLSSLEAFILLTFLTCPSFSVP